jgi:hypothetical protein
MLPLIKNEISESITLLNLAFHSEKEADRLKHLLNQFQTIEVWTQWLDLVKLNACESLVYLNVLKLKLVVPSHIESELKNKYDKISTENALRNKEAKAIFSELFAQHIPFVILKGQALADSLYGSLYYKKMNDVDFLVQKENLDKLDRIYKSLQLECAASLGGSNYRSQEKYSHHWPPFFTRSLDCVLGTHWNIITPLSDIKISEQELWKNTVPHSYLGIPCFRLNDLYFFFHLLVHLAYYKTGLKELADPVNWYRAKKKGIPFEALLELVKKSNAYDPVYRNLMLINRIYPDETLLKWVQALKPDVTEFVKDDTEFRCRELYYVIRSRSTQTSRIEKNYALFSLSDMFYEKFYFLTKMWKHFILPKKRDVIWMQSLPDSPNVFQLLCGYVRTPYLLSRVFAFDLGWKLHFLLIAKHHFDFLKSFGVFLLAAVSFGKIVPFPKTLTGKIRLLNLPVDSIEQIKTKLE